MTNKIKIFTISDHPLSPSGVGTQTKYMIEAMLKTGKYQFVSFGGAIQHPKHEPQHTKSGDTIGLFGQLMVMQSRYGPCYDTSTEA